MLDTAVIDQGAIEFSLFSRGKRERALVISHKPRA